MDYFKEPWNYIDLTPPIIVFAIAVINAGEIETPYESTLKSIGSLLMWLKLLYFCRINKTTGYLIRMIVKVIFGMRTFLMVLLITILAVADSYISIQPIVQPAPDGTPFEFSTYCAECFERFVVNVYLTYQLILGGDGFTVATGYELLGAVLNIFCKTFVMIVMLNLLIAIIGDIFGEVQQN